MKGTMSTASRKITRLSYANIMATVALCVALGGGAYAASTAPKNSVNSKSVKNDSLTGADLQERSLGAVPSAESATGVADNSITGGSVVNDSLSGADLNESSLGQVPSAAAVAPDSVTGAGVADDSLGGADVNESSLQLPAVPAAPDEATPISKRQSANTGFETVFEENGLRVEVDCSGALGSGNVRFDLLAPGVLERTALFNGGAVATGSQGGPANDAALANASVSGEIDVAARWRRDSDGKVVTVSMAVITTNGALSPITDCVHVGTALAEE